MDAFLRGSTLWSSPCHLEKREHPLEKEEEKKQEKAKEQEKGNFA